MEQHIRVQWIKNLIATGDLIIDPSRGTAYRMAPRGKVRPTRGKRGYMRLSLPGSYRAYVHRLVWIAVHGDLSPDLVINHKNNVPWDNRITNLEPLTIADNVRKYHSRDHYKYPVLPSSEPTGVSLIDDAVAFAATNPTRREIVEYMKINASRDPSLTQHRHPLGYVSAQSYSPRRLNTA